jgi:hypothetical protein
MTEPFGLCRLAVVAGLALDPGVLEDRDIEARGLFGLGIEPQKWRDPLRDLGH